MNVAGQIESFRTRLAAVTKEKYDNEGKVIKLSDEIEKKVRTTSGTAGGTADWWYKQLVAQLTGYTGDK